MLPDLYQASQKILTLPATTLQQGNQRCKATAPEPRVVSTWRRYRRIPELQGVMPCLRHRYQLSRAVIPSPSAFSTDTVYPPTSNFFDSKSREAQQKRSTEKVDTAAASGTDSKARLCSCHGLTTQYQVKSLNIYHCCSSSNTLSSNVCWKNLTF